jgi:microcystin-dependent protein
MLSKDQRKVNSSMVWRDDLSVSDYSQFGWETTSGTVQNISPAGFTGQIVLWPSRIVPSGWLRCDGSNVYIKDYPNLFQVLHPYIGTATFATSDVVTIVDHGLEDLDCIIFVTETGALPAPLELGTGYTVQLYVDVIDEDTFYVSYFPGLPRIDLTTTGSGIQRCHLAPYGLLYDDGTGNGLDFNIPSFVGKSPLGYNNLSSDTALGLPLGSSTHTHDIASHSHNLSASGHALLTNPSGTGVVNRRHSVSSWTATHQVTGTVGSNSSSYSTGVDLGGTTDASGTLTSTSYSSYHPSRTTNFIIKT